MKNFAIAFGFKGKLCGNIYKSWRILEEKFNIKYISSYDIPHLTILAGDTKKIEVIFECLKNEKIKKFKIFSPGLGIFANEKPNLYIRWDRSEHLLKNSKNITNIVFNLFENIHETSNFCSSKWVPKTTVAWKDLSYDNISSIYNEINFLFKKSYTIVDSIYFFDLSNNSLTHKIKLHN